MFIANILYAFLDHNLNIEMSADILIYLTLKLAEHA